VAGGQGLLYAIEEYLYQLGALGLGEVMVLPVLPVVVVVVMVVLVLAEGFDQGFYQVYFGHGDNTSFYCSSNSSIFTIFSEFILLSWVD